MKEWGPSGAPAALSVTFDNLGEAADLQQGLWPEGRPRGRHFSVVRALPRVLELLDEAGIRATFFVEGVNAEAYPRALEDIAAHGHELALHAWQHEEWGRLDASSEAELIERGTLAFAALGARPVGFRPPGGRLTGQSARILREHGYAYASPAGERAELVDGIAMLPFRWELVDAYHHFPRAGGLRARLVGEAPPRDPALPVWATAFLFRAAVRLGSLSGARRLRATMLKALGQLPADGGHRALLFHPFLLDWRWTVSAMRTVLGEVARLAEEGALWVAPMADVAERVRQVRRVG